MAAGGAAADQPHGGFLIEALGSFTGLRPVMQDSIHDLAKSHVGAVDPEIRHLVALDEAAHLVVSIIRKDLVPQIRIIRVALDDALALLAFGIPLAVLGGKLVQFGLQLTR